MFAIATGVYMIVIEQCKKTAVEITEALKTQEQTTREIKSNEKRYKMETKRTFLTRQKQ